MSQPDCTHHWTVTSWCPFCQQAEIERLRELVARYELAAANPGNGERHRGTSVAVQLVHCQHKREQAEVEIERLRDRESVLLKAAQQDDEEIAKLRAELDALREAGRNVLTTRHNECRASAALTTAKDNFASGYEAEQRAFVAAAIAASEAEKKLASMVFDDVINAARKP